MLTYDSPVLSYRQRDLSFHPIPYFRRLHADPIASLRLRIHGWLAPTTLPTSSIPPTQFHSFIHSLIHSFTRDSYFSLLHHVCWLVFLSCSSSPSNTATRRALLIPTYTPPDLIHHGVPSVLLTTRPTVPLIRYSVRLIERRNIN